MVVGRIKDFAGHVRLCFCVSVANKTRTKLDHTSDMLLTRVSMFKT